MEKGRQIFLLEKAVELQKQKTAEKESVEKAKEKIPQLKSKLDELFISKEPEDELKEVADNTLPNIFDKPVSTRRGPKGMTLNSRDSFNVSESTRRNFIRTNQIVQLIFNVPVEDEIVRITISNGERSSGRHMVESGYITRGYELDITELDFVLKVGDNSASIQSKAHYFAQSNPWDTIGPRSSSDLGPKWSREINMQDFENYDALLDRLNDPDVAVLRFVD